MANASSLTFNATRIDGRPVGLAGPIYTETFDGDGSVGIDGKTSTTGGGVWDAKNASLVSNDGTIAGTAGSTASFRS